MEMKFIEMKIRDIVQFILLMKHLLVMIIIMLLVIHHIDLLVQFMI